LYKKIICNKKWRIYLVANYQHISGAYTLLKQHFFL